jgi:hypothetical protein
MNSQIEENFPSNTLTLAHKDSTQKSASNNEEVQLDEVSISEVSANTTLTLDPNNLVDVSLQEKENPSNLTLAIDRIPTAGPVAVSFNLANSSIGAGNKTTSIVSIESHSSIQ